MLYNLYGNLIIRSTEKIFPRIQRIYFQHGGPIGRSLRSKRDLLQGISLFFVCFTQEKKNSQTTKQEAS